MFVSVVELVEGGELVGSMAMARLLVLGGGDMGGGGGRGKGAVLGPGVKGRGHFCWEKEGYDFKDYYKVYI